MKNEEKNSGNWKKSKHKIRWVKKEKRKVR